jgi:hypothetical protein
MLMADANKADVFMTASVGVLRFGAVAVGCYHQLPYLEGNAPTICPTEPDLAKSLKVSIKVACWVSTTS